MYMPVKSKVEVKECNYINEVNKSSKGFGFASCV